jgi:hypothetical protein
VDADHSTTRLAYPVTARYRKKVIANGEFIGINFLAEQNPIANVEQETLLSCKCLTLNYCPLHLHCTHTSHRQGAWCSGIHAPLAAVIVRWRSPELDSCTSDLNSSTSNFSFVNWDYSSVTSNSVNYSNELTPHRILPQFLAFTSVVRITVPQAAAVSDYQFIYPINM